jgi:hypothetical protein
LDLLYQGTVIWSGLERATKSRNLFPTEPELLAALKDEASKTVKCVAAE